MGLSGLLDTELSRPRLRGTVNYRVPADPQFDRLQPFSVRSTAGHVVLFTETAVCPVFVGTTRTDRLAVGTSGVLCDGRPNTNCAAFVPYISQLLRMDERLTVPFGAHVEIVAILRAAVSLSIEPLARSYAKDRFIVPAIGPWLSGRPRVGGLLWSDHAWIRDDFDCRSVGGR